jgi:hypothetical protein
MKGQSVSIAEGKKSFSRLIEGAVSKKERFFEAQVLLAKRSLKRREKNWRKGCENLCHRCQRRT